MVAQIRRKCEIQKTNVIRLVIEQKKKWNEAKLEMCAIYTLLRRILSIQLMRVIVCIYLDIVYNEYIIFRCTLQKVVN